MSINIFSPSKYIQGFHISDKLASYCKKFSKRAVLILIDHYAESDLRDALEIQFEKEKLKMVIEIFRGECCEEEIKKIKAVIKENKIDLVAGIGGGKVTDTAKAAAYFAKLPLIVMPTVASTDGPCSSISVLYKKDGTFKEYLNLTNSPNMVLVDTGIIAKAPVKLFVSGMGDALSTFFETEACYESQIEQFGRSTISIAARQLSKATLETLLTYGIKAKTDVENGQCTEAVDKVTEAILYLSCMGFESGGLAAAHAVANALTFTEQGAKFLHGEKVAFGTFVQLLLENSEAQMVVRLRDFCHAVGLPVCLKDLGISSEEDIQTIAKEACKPTQPFHNMKASLKDEKLLIEAMRFTNHVTR